MKSTGLLNILIYAGIALLVSSCNKLPSVDRLQTLEINLPEGMSKVTTLVFSDLKKDKFKQNLSGGEDRDKFLFSPDGKLTFAITTDFENPMDANKDNIYRITITASDDKKTLIQDVKITVTNNLEGRVVDGPLSNSTLFIDLNGDLHQDDNEIAVSSDSQGFFAIPDSAGGCLITDRCDALLVSLGGTDISTNTNMEGLVLYGRSIPGQALNITPLSTLIAEADDPQTLVQALGFNQTVSELISIDPWAMAKSDNNQDWQLQKVNQQIAIILQSANSLVEGQNITGSATTKKIASVMSDRSNAGTLDLLDNALIQEVLNNATNQQGVSQSIDTEIISTVAQSIVQSNSIIASESFDPVSTKAAEIVTAIQITLQSAIKDLVSGDITLNSFVKNTTTETLFKRPIPKELEQSKIQAQTMLTAIDSDAAKADKIMGNTKVVDTVKNIINTATTIAETDIKKAQASEAAEQALIKADEALATAKQETLTALTATDSDAAKADKINGDAKAVEAVTSSINTATTISETDTKKTQASEAAEQALIKADEALATAKQETLTALTATDSDAAKADKINGDTQAVEAVTSSINTATTIVETDTKKAQATTGAENALVKANQDLATAKQQAITALTATDSDAAKADKINGDTQAIEAVTSSINTAVTLAETEAKKTQASDLAQQKLAKAIEENIKPQLTVTIDSPASLTTLGATPVTVTGKVAGDIIALTVNGASITADEGQYTADVSLREGHNNIVARAVDEQNNVFTASISVSLDMTPPTITVESPTPGSTLYSDSVTVTGLINDIVRGTIEQHQANVIANGIAGTVSNRSYSVKDIPLQLGENKITLIASDQVGNSAQKTMTIHYKQPLGKKLQLLGGQDQSVQIGAIIDQPLAVKVVDDTDAPVVDQTVVFRVIQGSGALEPNTQQQGRAIAVKTNAEGQAQTSFRLGQRVGTANHKVRATITGYQGEIIFNASGLAKIGNKISVNSGNNQRGVAGQPLPAPFVVAVTDTGANVVSGSRVKFQVTKGGGRFYNPKSEYQTRQVTTKTDSDGRASVQFIIGQLQGLDAQRVTATLIDSPQGKTLSAGFTASAFIPADPGKTSLSGVVLNNQDQPLQGVTLRIEGTTRQAVSNDQGRFTITEVPVGPVHLIADGSTTLASGEYPSLGYQLVTIAGVDNPMATPIYMVKLDIQGAQYAGKKDISLTLEKFPGFQLDIAKGSVTFPDGAKEGFISVTSVNTSAVPMAPPNGMQPQFIVTIQPAGTLFDPPARLTLPNVDGHAPGAQVEMYSFDHDLEEFVAIGLGTVTEDGSVVATNSGVGVIKAGWHCGSQPANSGCVSGKSCSFCKKSRTGDCSDNDCIEDLAKSGVPLPADQQTAGDCQTETCSGSVAADDKPADEVCKKCENKALVVDTDKEGSAPSSNAPCAICQSGSLVNNQQLGKNVTVNDPYVCKTCQSRELHNKPDSTAPLSNDRCQICQNGQLKSKLELNDVPEPAQGAELEFDATEAAGSLIKKINTGLSKLGIAAEVSNVTIGAAGKFKHCCVPETGEIKQNQTQEASAQVGLTIEADEVKIPGFTYGLDNTEIIFGPAFAIRFSARLGVLVSVNTDIAISTGLRIEGCGGDTCNFGTATLGISPTLKPTAKIKGCVEFFSDRKCAGGGVEAPISTSVFGDLNYNKTACNQGISGTVTIDPITAKGSIFAELGAKEYALPFGPIQFYEGGSF